MRELPDLVRVTGITVFAATIGIGVGILLDKGVFEGVVLVLLVVEAAAVIVVDFETAVLVEVAVVEVEEVAGEGGGVVV